MGVEDWELLSVLSPSPEGIRWKNNNKRKSKLSTEMIHIIIP